VIKFENISKIYPAGLTALDNVSFEVGAKEFISLVGKSGAGKSTLLKLLLIEEKPTQGNILFNDQNLGKLNKEEIPKLRRKIGSVFQDYKLIPTKTTYENIAYILEVIGASDAEISRDVAEVLDIVGLTSRAHNFPAELSGGEKQRVAIARALIHRPEIILADEPTGNLDPYHTLEIIRLLLKINELGTTVILATHNKDVINSLGKRVITMQAGRIIRDEAVGRFVL